MATAPVSARNDHLHRRKRFDVRGPKMTLRDKEFTQGHAERGGACFTTELGKQLGRVDW